MIDQVVKSLAKQQLSPEDFGIADVLSRLVREFQTDELVSPELLGQLRQTIKKGELDTYDDDGLAEGIFDIIVEILNDIETSCHLKIIKIIDILYDSNLESEDDES